MAQGESMSFDPRTYFVGLMDFFSILLPGALLTYAGKDWVSNRMGGTDVQLDGAESVILFLFSSYLVGHLTFLVSSALDDWVYDPLRKKTDRGQIKQLADGDPLSWRWCRSLA
jgi:hypothetical protein